MRSSAAQKQSDGLVENAVPGEIQMQSFQEGLPPPPPVTHSWRRIDKWAEDHYEELYEELGEGCTTNDLNDLEHQLDCSLPMDVRESLQVHDGQEVGGRPTGIIFGCMLLDCEEIVHEWQNWKTVNEQYLAAPVNYKPSTPVKALGGSSSASSSKQPAQTSSNPMWRQDLMAKQDAQPPGAIQRVYAHPAWIPLARDWGGNNLAVDLAPGPTGKWGQVILFGRDYDCKYVVARSWSAFLATVADDLNSGKWFIDEDTNELKLREFKTSHVEPPYLDILRWRADQKYGRRNLRRRSAGPTNISVKTSGSPTASPYDSPVADVGEPRGRSMQRFGGASPVSSPNRPSYAKSSPLSKVAEEIPASKLALKTDVSKTNGTLVEVGTPRESDEKKRAETLETLLEPVVIDDDKENKAEDTSDSKLNGTAKKQATVEDDNVMKTIEI
jgi:cell wall assembly regulator SMI1